jgi:hypothetical protein
MLPVLTATAERLLSSDSDWASGSRSNFIIIIFFHRLVSWPVDGFHSFTYISLGWFPSSSDLFFCWPLPKSTSIFCLLVSYFPLQLLELRRLFLFPIRRVTGLPASATTRRNYFYGPRLLKGPLEIK